MDPQVVILTMQKASQRFPVRAWGTMFERNRFDMPSMTAKSLGGRLEANLNFFLANYVILGALVLIYSMFRSLVFVFTFMAICSIWTWLVVLRNYEVEGDVDILGLRLPALPFYVGLSIASAVSMALTAGLPISFWMILVISHATFRKRSMKSQFSLFAQRARGTDVVTSVAQGMDHLVPEETVTIDLSAAVAAPPSSRPAVEQYRRTSDAIRQKYAGKEKFAKE